MPYEEQRDKEKLRKLYMAYANITRDADKAKFLTAQTIQEAGWDMSESGKNNFSGVKENNIKKGSMVKTTEDLKAYTHKDKKRILSDKEGLLKLTDDISKRGGSVLYNKNGMPEKNKKGYIFVMDRFKDFDTIEESLRSKVEMIERKYNKAYNAKTIEEYTKGLEGYATDSDYFKGVSGVATGKTLNNKVLGDLVQTTKENLKNTRMQSFKARENLIKLMNASPAQMEQYHKGVVDRQNNRGTN